MVLSYQNQGRKSNLSISLFVDEAKMVRDAEEFLVLDCYGLHFKESLQTSAQEWEIEIMFYVYLSFRNTFY